VPLMQFRGEDWLRRMMLMRVRTLENISPVLHLQSTKGCCDAMSEAIDREDANQYWEQAGVAELRMFTTM
jgi:hypothetical protein